MCSGVLNTLLKTECKAEYPDHSTPAFLGGKEQPIDHPTVQVELAIHHLCADQAIPQPEPAREDGFVPLEGDGAHLPHPHSDHVRMEMYGATVRCRARDVRLVLPESEDVVVDVYSALGRPNDDPHWADLWHGGAALAAEIFAEPELVRGKRVIDLGCGLGIAGIAAAMVGAPLLLSGALYLGWARSPA